MTQRTVAATNFKAHCLALLDQVSEKRITLVVTKRGRAVARIVPVDTDPRKPLKGSVKLIGRADKDYFTTGEAFDDSRASAQL
jgi:prevent-host-death family protein